MHRLPRTALAAAVLFASPGGWVGGAAHAASPGYTAEPGPFRKTARFVVRYTGSGTSRTDYHSEPPNEGGKHDTNDVHDSSTQSWALRYRVPLTIPTCEPGDADPCAEVGPLRGALGRMRATGRVDHKHVDGLYRELDSGIKCRVSSTPNRRPFAAVLGVDYAAGPGAFVLRGFNPVEDALALLPGQCPGQGDSLDLILDNYFTPGFSFADGYGPERWFTSRRVVIPTAALHRSSRITVPLGLTQAGRSPTRCAVRRRWERCHTRGLWRGTLTLSRVSG